MGDASMPDAVRFDGLFPNLVVAQFDQPDSSSDAGAVLHRTVDERLGLPRSLAGALTDRRQGSKVQHSPHDVPRQRPFAIDRLSCTRFLANQARLLLYAAA